MNDGANAVEDIAVKERQEIVAAAYAIAASLQKTSSPIRTIQILSCAVGMTLCASVKKREDVGSVMETFVSQVNMWCDFEESQNSTSWQDKAAELAANDASSKAD